MNKDEALKLALDALENTTPTGFNMERDKQFFAAITAIKEALALSESSTKCEETSHAQPEQNEFNPDWDAMAVMVEEQQRMAKRIAELEAQRKPLTDEEIEKIIKSNMSLQMNLAGIRADFEVAHGIKE